MSGILITVGMFVSSPYHAIMMLPLNTLPMRAPAALKATAKLGMCHQHVLVFYKGPRAPTTDKVQAMGLRNAQRPLEWR